MKYEYIILNIKCSNHAVSEIISTQKTHLLYKDSFFYEYEGAFSIENLEKKIKECIPQNICCSSCHSCKHNSISYEFHFVGTIKTIENH